MKDFIKVVFSCLVAGFVSSWLTAKLLNKTIAVLEAERDSLKDIIEWRFPGDLKSQFDWWLKADSVYFWRTDTLAVSERRPYFFFVFPQGQKQRAEWFNPKKWPPDTLIHKPMKRKE